MKKYLKIIYPFLCVIVPFAVYLLCDGQSVLIPCIIASPMFGAFMLLYENKVISTTGLVASLLSPLAMMIFPLYYTYLLSGWWCLLLPCGLVLTYLFRLLTKRLIHGGNSFKGIILTRKMMIVCMTLTAIAFIVPGLYSIMDSQEWSRHRYSFDENMAGLFGSAAWILLAGVQIYKSTRRVYVFSNYYKPYYILFLRRFIKDDQSQVIACLDALTHNGSGYDVMKIGDPNTLFSHSDLYDTVYLTSVDWQAHLREHIKCAKLVFSVVDTSEGVIWEMTSNTEFLNKYIYCLPDWENVDEIKKKLNEHASQDGVLNHRLQYFLSSLQAQGTKEMVLFAFEDDKVVYTNNLKAAVDYKLTSRWHTDLHVMNA